METKEEPAEDSPDRQEFDNWFLLAGYHRYEGRNWPPPPPPARPSWWPDHEVPADTGAPWKAPERSE